MKDNTSRDSRGKEKRRRRGTTPDWKAASWGSTEPVSPVSIYPGACQPRIAESIQIGCYPPFPTGGTLPDFRCHAVAPAVELPRGYDFGISGTASSAPQGLKPPALLLSRQVRGRSRAVHLHAVKLNDCKVWTSISWTAHRRRSELFTKMPHNKNLLTCTYPMCEIGGRNDAITSDMNLNASRNSRPGSAASLRLASHCNLSTD